MREESLPVNSDGLIGTDSFSFPPRLRYRTFTCRSVTGKLTVAGQKSWLEFFKARREDGGRLIGVRRQFLDVEMRHGHSDLLVDGLDFDGRFQVLRLVLDGRFPLRPHLDHFLLGIDEDFVGEAVVKVDGAAAAAQPDQNQQSGQWKAVARRRHRARRHSSTCDR